MVRLLVGTFNAPEEGLLSGGAPQEFAKVSPTKPRGAYLYIRASAAGARGVRHQVLGRLPTRPGVRVRPPLAGYEALVFFELL